MILKLRIGVALVQHVAVKVKYRNAEFAVAFILFKKRVVALPVQKSGGKFGFFFKTGTYDIFCVQIYGNDAENKHKKN